MYSNMQVRRARFNDFGLSVLGQYSTQHLPEPCSCDIIAGNGRELWCEKKRRCKMGWNHLCRLLPLTMSDRRALGESFR